MTATLPLALPSPAQPPRLLDQFRAAARRAGQPETWIEPLTSWATAFIIFHGKRHPRELDAAARDAFLRHVVQSRKDPLAALAGARQALRLLYEDVLHSPVGELPQPRPPRLLDQMRQVMRLGHYSPKTEQNYVWWATKFILFHGKRHPRDMRAPQKSSNSSPTSLPTATSPPAHRTRRSTPSSSYMAGCWTSTSAASTRCGAAR